MELHLCSPIWLHGTGRKNFAFFFTFYVLENVSALDECGDERVNTTQSNSNAKSHTTLLTSMAANTKHKVHHIIQRQQMIIKIMRKPWRVGTAECLCWCCRFEINDSFDTSFFVSNHESGAIKK